MGFFKNVISGFREAAKAGGEFNPVMESVLGKLEDLHAQGKLNDVVYQAEQSYEKEHAEYTAKGIHTDAADSQRDLAAMKHFLDTLQSNAGSLDPAVKTEVQTLLDLRDKMEHILSNAFKKN